jgi:Ion channel
MALDRARTALGQVFYQRCFYLFIALLVLVGAALAFDPSPRDRVLLNAINLLIDVSAVAAIARTRWSFVIASLLAIPAMLFQLHAIISDDSSHLIGVWAFNAALYGVTIGYLLRYVFLRDVITGDKLWGAAAGYLMLGALWGFLYAIAESFQPGSFAGGGVSVPPRTADLLYFSFTVLTSTGFGDIVPVLRYARTLCVLEQLTGALFLAILIARLAGVYPPPPPRAPILPPREPLARRLRRQSSQSSGD